MSRPYDRGLPFWTRRDFRWLIIAMVMGISTIAVLVFEVGPTLQKRAKRVRSDANGPEVYVPKGESKEIRFDGVLEQVKDGTPLNDRDEPYYTLMRYLNGARPDELAKQAKQVEYGYYSKISPELRGQVARITALYVDSDSPERLGKKSGIPEFVTRAYLVDLSGEEWYIVDLIDPPPQIERRSLVSVDAVFLKNASYEGKNGVVQAPLFLGKALRPLKEKVAAGSIDMGVLVVAMSVAFVLLTVVLSLRVFQKRPVRAPLPPGPRPI